MRRLDGKPQKYHDQRREKNPCWKGGLTKSGKGYILIRMPNHPFNNYGYVRMHRLLMEEKLGRYLTSDEIIHHINGIKHDNRIENLELMKNGEHSSFHNKKNIPNCKLTWKKAGGIRVMRMCGYTLKEISKKYKVSQATISRIISNKIWSNDGKA